MRSDKLKVKKSYSSGGYTRTSVNTPLRLMRIYKASLSSSTLVHLLLLDYKISEMSGDFIARKINEYSGTKIILISAYNLDDSLLKELIESNCIAKFIKKPINLSSLIEQVADTINQIETVSQNS